MFPRQLCWSLIVYLRIYAHHMSLSRHHNHQWCCLKSCWNVLLPWIKRHCIWIPRFWARCTHWQSCLYVWKTSLSILGKLSSLDSRQDSCLCGLRAQHAALRLWNLANIPIRKKGSTCSIFAAYNPSSVTLGMTVYQILQLWRELVLPIYSLSLEYIDYAGVAMCAE